MCNPIQVPYSLRDDSELEVLDTALGNQIRELMQEQIKLRSLKMNIYIRGMYDHLVENQTIHYALGLYDDSPDQLFYMDSDCDYLCMGFNGLTLDQVDQMKKWFAYYPGTFLVDGIVTLDQEALHFIWTPVKAYIRKEEYLKEYIGNQWFNTKRLTTWERSFADVDSE